MGASRPMNFVMYVLSERLNKCYLFLFKTNCDSLVIGINHKICLDFFLEKLPISEIHGIWLDLHYHLDHNCGVGIIGKIADSSLFVVHLYILYKHSKINFVIKKLKMDWNCVYWYEMVDYRDKGEWLELYTDYAEKLGVVKAYIEWVVKIFKTYIFILIYSRYQYSKIVEYLLVPQMNKAEISLKPNTETTS